MLFGKVQEWEEPSQDRTDCCGISFQQAADFAGILPSYSQKWLKHSLSLNPSCYDDNEASMLVCTTFVEVTKYISILNAGCDAPCKLKDITVPRDVLKNDVLYAKPVALISCTSSMVLTRRII